MILEIYLVNTSRMENEGASTVCPLDPGSPLFLSGDGFEPVGVLFPHAVFHFPSKEKKEAYDFMDKVGFFTFLLNQTTPSHTKRFLVLGRRQASPPMWWEAAVGPQEWIRGWRQERGVHLESWTSSEGACSRASSLNVPQNLKVFLFSYGLIFGLRPIFI